ncbi:MAG: hypothetical protein AAFV62_10350, partial [Pseudomonadota bacterium]
NPDTIDTELAFASRTNWLYDCAAADPGTNASGTSAAAHSPVTPLMTRVTAFPKEIMRRTPD